MKKLNKNYVLVNEACRQNPFLKDALYHRFFDINTIDEIKNFENFIEAYDFETDIFNFKTLKIGYIKEFLEFSSNNWIGFDDKKMNILLNIISIPVSSYSAYTKGERNLDMRSSQVYQNIYEYFDNDRIDFLSFYKVVDKYLLKIITEKYESVDNFNKLVTDYCSKHSNSEPLDNIDDFQRFIETVAYIQTNLVLTLFWIFADCRDDKHWHKNMYLVTNTSAMNNLLKHKDVINSIFSLNIKPFRCFSYNAHNYLFRIIRDMKIYVEFNDTEIALNNFNNIQSKLNTMFKYTLSYESNYALQYNCDAEDTFLNPAVMNELNPNNTNVIDYYAEKSTIKKFTTVDDILNEIPVLMKSFIASKNMPIKSIKSFITNCIINNRKIRDSYKDGRRSMVYRFLLKLLLKESNDYDSYYTSIFRDATNKLEFVKELKEYILDPYFLMNIVHDLGFGFYTNSSAKRNKKRQLLRDLLNMVLANDQDEITAYMIKQILLLAAKGRPERLPFGVPNDYLINYNFLDLLAYDDQTKFNKRVYFNSTVTDMLLNDPEIDIYGKFFILCKRINIDGEKLDVLKFFNNLDYSKYEIPTELKNIIVRTVNMVLCSGTNVINIDSYRRLGSTLWLGQNGLNSVIDFLKNDDDTFFNSIRKKYISKYYIDSSNLRINRDECDNYEDAFRKNMAYIDTIVFGYVGIVLIKTLEPIKESENPAIAECANTIQKLIIERMNNLTIDLIPLNIMSSILFNYNRSNTSVPIRVINNFIDNGITNENYVSIDNFVIYLDIYRNIKSLGLSTVVNTSLLEDLSTIIYPETSIPQLSCTDRGNWYHRTDDFSAYSNHVKRYNFLKDIEIDKIYNILLYDIDKETFEKFKNVLFTNVLTLENMVNIATVIFKGQKFDVSGYNTYWYNDNEEAIRFISDGFDPGTESVDDCISIVDRLKQIASSHKIMNERNIILDSMAANMVELTCNIVKSFYFKLFETYYTRDFITIDELNDAKDSLDSVISSITCLGILSE